MKRSDMINFMYEEIKEALEARKYSNETDGRYWHRRMTSLLDMMEGFGMAPPGYMKPIPFESDGKQYPLVPGDFTNDVGIWCTPGVREWEKE